MVVVMMMMMVMVMTMMVVAMMTMLVNFQPLVHKVIAAYRINGDSQASIDNMIKVVREQVPKLESKGERD